MGRLKSCGVYAGTGYLANVAIPVMNVGDSCYEWGGDFMVPSLHFSAEQPLRVPHLISAFYSEQTLRSTVNKLGPPTPAC